MVEVVWGNSSTDWGEEMMKGSNDFNQNLTLLHWKKYPLVTSGDGENWDELDLITNAQMMQGKMLNIWFSQIMSILHSGRQSSRPFQFTHFCSSPVLAWYKTVGTCWNCWNTVELLEEMATAGRLTTQIIRHTHFSEYFALCVCIVIIVISNQWCWWWWLKRSIG